MASRKDMSEAGAGGHKISKLQTLRFRRTFKRYISGNWKRLLRRLIGILLFLKSDHFAANPQTPSRSKTRCEIALQLRHALLAIRRANIFALRLDDDVYQLLLML